MKNKNWVPYLVYGLLALAILGPLLFPGYILSLDMVFTPKQDSSFQLFGQWESVSAQLPFSVLQQLISEVMPSWLLQKIILFLAFFLAGLGAHKLFPSNKAGSYFAGVLYAVNPFTYIRFVAGQWPLLAAYGLTPFTIKAFLDLLEKGGMKNAIIVALLSTLAGIMCLHSLFLLFLIFLILLIVRATRERKNRTELLRTSRYAGISAALFLVLNVYWLVPVLMIAPTKLGQIGQEDLFQFAPEVASMFDLASLHGFWNSGFIYASDLLPFWPVLFFFILILVAYGILWRPAEDGRNWVATSLALAGLVGFILAMGVSFRFTRPLFEWLFDNLVFFKGFRDSQKFGALLCLAYAYLGGMGVERIVGALRQGQRTAFKIGARVFIVLVLFLPLLYSFTIFGSWGQLQVTDYPSEWNKVNSYLNEDEQDFSVLFLPWHQYMDFSWLPNDNNRMANPAWQFFTKPVICGDNIEIWGQYSESTNPISKYVEFLLSHKELDNLGELLAPLNVKYIILVHEADYARYDFLNKQADLAVELKMEGLTLFRNLHPVARAYGVNSLVYIKDWEEYLKLSKTQDTTEHVYIIGEGENSSLNTGMDRLDLISKNPARYQVTSNGKYTVFTVPQIVNTENWEYNGQSSMENLGFMPAFISDKDGGELVYTRFYRVYLPCYIVSFTMFLVMLYYYFFHKKRTLFL